MQVKIVAVWLISCICTAMGATLNPITRVVELLKGLAEKAEDDLKKEQSMFEDYICWAKTIIASKTGSNTNAKSRIDALKAYIADLDAGRIELTSERKDLEKELQQVNQELETAEAMRTQEKNDYEAAKDEMDKAVTALESAIEVLDEATKDHKEGELIELHGNMVDGFSSRVEEAKLLAHAVEVGRQFLSDGDALFMSRILTGEVPEKDWKRLNKKASFKMSYKARSFKIQGLLNKLLVNFQKSLKDATAKEEEAVEVYEKLKKAKDEQKENLEEALNSMAGEGGARGVSKEEAQEEIDSLTSQIQADDEFISDARKAITDKTKEWDARKNLRTGEIAAINKAISILFSDDARDLFRKSHSSQGYSFLQTKIRSTVLQQLTAVSGIFTNIAQKSGDSRVMMLEVLTARDDPKPRGKEHFKTVIKAIDDMIDTLNDEEKQDNEQKEECEKDRMDNTRDAVVDSRAIDDLTDTITKLNGEIKEREESVAEKNVEIDRIEEELKKAEKIRNDAHAMWEANDADDKAAKGLVGDAKNVLKNFYEDNELNLIQRRDAPAITAGEAPPPPPPTWENPDYEGAKGESNGIVAILEMIEDDIEKDITKAKNEEDASKTEYDEFVDDSNADLKTLNEDITTLKGEIGTREEKISGHKTDRKDKKADLDATLKTIKDEVGGCDYIAINYEVRRGNRHIEVDGLKKAKAILEGGEFSDGEF